MGRDAAGGGSSASGARDPERRSPDPDARTPESGARRSDHSVKLVLWRHGQTEWNMQGRFQGQTDIPLDEVGQQQAERAARLLAALQPNAIFSSDLIRAAATAAPLARLTGLTVTPDKDLRERYGGLWEGLTDTEIRARYPVEHSQWRPPEGETSAAVADRACAAMERISNTLTPGSLAVVASHGAALRLGAARLLVVGPRPSARQVAAHRAQRRNTARAGAQRRPLTASDLVHWRGAAGRSTPQPRGYSSVGRALAWHARGQGFESP